MKTQTALVRALNQMGYETKGMHNTAQIQWEREQNRELERLCVERGLEIEHPDIEKQKHLNINEYRQKKRIEELERKNAELVEKNNELIDKVNELIDYHNDLNADIDELEAGAVELAHEVINHTIDRNLVR